MGATWTYGVLGRKDGVLYSVLQGSGINAVVLPGPNSTNELRVYFTKREEESLAVAYMPLVGNTNNWDIASRLRSVDEPW